MADIADEAGISRQSVYRFFEDRSTLIQYILNRRISGMADSLVAQFRKYKQMLRDFFVPSILASAPSRTRRKP